jgi:hypothetical protein
MICRIRRPSLGIACSTQAIERSRCICLAPGTQFSWMHLSRGRVTAYDMGSIMAYLLGITLIV